MVRFYLRRAVAEPAAAAAASYCRVAVVITANRDGEMEARADRPFAGASKCALIGDRACAAMLLITDSDRPALIWSSRSFGPSESISCGLHRPCQSSTRPTNAPSGVEISRLQITAVAMDDDLTLVSKRIFTVACSEGATVGTVCAQTAFEPTGGVINKVCDACTSATPALRSPSWLRSITATPPSTSTKLYCLVTEAGVRQRGLPASVLDIAMGETRTRDLSITSPTFYH